MKQKEITISILKLLIALVLALLVFIMIIRPITNRVITIEEQCGKINIRTNCNYEMCVLKITKSTIDLQLYKECKELNNIIKEYVK